MGQLLIRNVDDAVIARLEARAAARNRPLEAELRDLVSQAAAPSRAELVEEFRRIQAMTPDKPDRKLAEDYIREDRDSR